MNTINRICTLTAMVATFTALSGCKRGFEFNDVDDTVSITYAGPSESASWTIYKPNASGSFTLEKRLEPDDEDLEYDDEDLTGSFTNLSSGFIRFDINSDIPDEINDNDSSTDDDIIVGIQIADHAVVLYPFEVGSNELIYLVPIDEETCPSSGSGTGLFIDKTGVTDLTENYINTFAYSSSSEAVTLSNGIALDDDFTEPFDVTYTLYDDDCSESITSTIDGDYYHGDTASVMEVDEDDYYRFISFSTRSITSLSAFDSEDYVGFLNKYSEPEESYYISASCIEGVCTIREESDYATLTAVEERYRITLTEESRNEPKSGMITGTIEDLVTTTNAAANVACIVNTSTDDDDDSDTTTMLVACNAQTPGDTSETIHLVLKVDID